MNYYEIKSQFEPTLFLNKKYINTPNQLVVTVGDFFEQATANLYNFKRIKNDSTYEVIPDLVSENRDFYIESKAGIRGFAIRKDQLECYINCGVEIWFCFWQYAPNYFINPIASNEPEKIQDIIANSIKGLYCLHMECIKDLMHKSKGKNVKRITPKELDSYLLKKFCHYDTVENLEVYGHKTNKFPRTICGGI